MTLHIQVVFNDSAEEVHMPQRAGDIIPFVRCLWVWQARFFWLLAIEHEMLLLFYLLKIFPLLEKLDSPKARLEKLADGINILKDELDCNVTLVYEMPSFPEAMKGLWKWACWTRKRILHRMLLWECYFWDILSQATANEKLKDLFNRRSMDVSLASIEVWGFEDTKDEKPD